MVISIYCHIHHICKSSLWQLEHLHYFSTYWILIIFGGKKVQNVFKENKTFCKCYGCFYTYSSGVCGTPNDEEVKPMPTEQKGLKLGDKTDIDCMNNPCWTSVIKYFWNSNNLCGAAKRCSKPDNFILSSTGETKVSNDANYVSLNFGEMCIKMMYIDIHNISVWQNVHP